jgi:hypothetical protein
MCGCTGNGNSALSPVRDIILRNPAMVIGARSARSSVPPSGWTEGVPFFTRCTCRSPRARSTTSQRSPHASAGRRPMPERDEDHRRVAVPVASPLAPGLHEQPDFLDSQVLAGSRVRLRTRRGGTVPVTAIGVRRRLPRLPFVFRVGERITVPQKSPIRDSRSLPRLARRGRNTRCLTKRFHLGIRASNGLHWPLR